MIKWTSHWGSETLRVYQYTDVLYEGVRQVEDAKDQDHLETCISVYILPPVGMWRQYDISLC